MGFLSNPLSYQRELDSSYACGNYDPLDINIVRGGGCKLYDENDREYLDLFGSYAVTNFGNSNPELVRVSKDQVEKLPVCSRALNLKIFEDFCRELALFCRLDKVLPAITGTEAIDKAIKVVRMWCFHNKKTDGNNPPTIISFRGNFHGRSFGALSMSTTEKYLRGFKPLLPGFTHLRFGDADSLGNVAGYLKPNLAAIFVEPIQGEGGVMIPPDGYLKNVRRICDENNCLMVVDEIQTGFGRTGYDLAHHYESGVLPDVVVVGKALGGGLLPVSAVVAKKEIMDFMGVGSDGSTFAGYPLGCAVAIESIRLLQRKRLSERARNIGEYFLSGLRTIKLPIVTEVRGRGLMIGVELATEENAKRALVDLSNEGIICGRSHRVLRISPPLAITKEEIDWAIPRIEKVLKGSA